MKSAANLVTAVWICLTLPLTLSLGIWKCSGEESTMTSRDCQMKSSLTRGCYYIEHTYKFKSCSLICNNVEFISPSEMVCREHCPGYLLRNCQVVEATTANASSTTRLENGTEEKLSKAPEPATMMSNQMVQTMIALLVVVSLMIVVAIGIAVVKVKRNRYHQLTYQGLSTHTFGKETQRDILLTHDFTKLQHESDATA